MKNGVPAAVWYYLLDFKDRNLKDFHARYWSDASLAKLTSIQLQDYFRYATDQEISNFKG